MKTIKSILLEDHLLLNGILCICFSATLFALSGYFSTNAAFGFFLCNYAFAMSYTTVLIVKGFLRRRLKPARSRIDYLFVLLILWLISAFSLNKQMNIFYESGTWLAVYICLASMAVLACTIQEALPLYLRQVLIFLLGASLLLFMYYAIYLFPYYVISALAAIFFGLSVHSFIPIFLSIVIMVMLVRMLQQTPVLKYGLIAGILIPSLITIFFILQWNRVHQSVTLAQNHNTLNESPLPEWVVVARQLPKSAITEKYLKAGLVYATPDKNSDWFFGNFGGNFSEPKKHDPLVMISSLLIGKSDIDEDNRIKILKSVYDSRHLAQERLWSGDQLTTENIVSNVKIYPEYRMAYTEKTLSIRNNEEKTWRNDAEAIYTFHLPEGSVLSSLSLWVNGIEEKARLSTKSKADSAYKSIVGVESRDPSLVHWQEGNTITVRVFPCSPNEMRKFKIGITSPLKATRNELIYENAWFDGPSPSDATESIQVDFSSRPQQLDTSLKLDKTGKYTEDRNYKDKWALSFAKTRLATSSFSFGNNSYQLKEKRMISSTFKPNAIYLDLNSAWSEQELKSLWAQIKDQKVYIFDETLKRVTTDQLSSIYKDLGTLNFSLFPFYKIADPENALVITKGNAITPNLSDLSGSIFQKSTSDFLACAKPFHLYNIGAESSPYLKTLKEFGVFIYSEGSLENLQEKLRQQQFEAFQKQENILTIPTSGMAIEKLQGTVTGNTTAPDHLLRLFAYNDILKKVGATYFEKDYVRDDLLTMANQAFIVSPVSSMIVLETKQDYERFGIEESKDSLKNASIQSSGAAPEPHEWMLILLCLAVMAYYGFKSGYLNKFRPI